MATTEITDSAIAAATATIANDQPIVMLNLLRYREVATYDDPTTDPPCTGREAYHTRYVPAFRQFAPAGIGLFWSGGVLAGLVADPDEHWDEAALVRYPNFAAFRSVIDNLGYRAEAEPHRHAALADWRLIAIAEAP